MTNTKARIYFERILCPIGLTADSDEALRYGIALAKAYGARLFVMHCTDPYEKNTTEPGHIKKQLREVTAKHLRQPSSTRLETEIILADGDAHAAIALEAAERRIDLIVMRSRRRPYAAALLGSTAESVCRTAPCPVLITHPREREWVGMTTNEVGLRRVLVAHDFSSDSELALSYGLSLAQEYQAELHLLHVVPPRAKPETPEAAYLPFGAEDSFSDAALRLKSALPDETLLWCDVKHAVRQGQPYREVLAYAEEQKIDLICVGASGTGFGMRALFGSNSDRVLRQAPCPVLIARPLRPAFAVQAAAATIHTKAEVTK
jgi:nucleotide-binding universal stress UspA family protein